MLEWVYGTIVSTAEKARDGAKRPLGAPPRMSWRALQVLRCSGASIQCHKPISPSNDGPNQRNDLARGRWVETLLCRPCSLGCARESPATQAIVGTARVGGRRAELRQ